MNNYADIIDYLKTNPDIVAKVGTEAFFPIFTTETNRATITYSVTADFIGVINSGNLNLKVIAPSYDEAMQVSYLINKLMAMNDYIYKRYKTVYFYSEYVGGGCLFNPDYRMYENTINFNLKWRCI